MLGGGLSGGLPSGLGGWEGSQSSWGLANLCWYRNGGARASKPVLAQHLVLGGLPDLSGTLKVISVAY